MKLYIVSVSTDDYDDYDYAEYNASVIAANSEEEAKEYAKLPGNRETWKVEEIGTYSKTGVGLIMPGKLNI